jgi:hypothetical protein
MTRQRLTTPSPDVGRIRGRGFHMPFGEQKLPLVIVQ